MLSEDDSDAESRDSDYEIIEEMKKANKQKRKALDEIRIPASCPVRVLPVRKESDRHMAARAQSLRNRAILESLKADLEAETPEPREGKGAPNLLTCIWVIRSLYISHLLVRVARCSESSHMHASGRSASCMSNVLVRVALKPARWEREGVPRIAGWMLIPLKVIYGPPLANSSFLEAFHNRWFLKQTS